MDIDSMLNIERRTGVKNSDIDDFLSKADAVEAAIRGMRDGTIDPSNVKIEGIDTPEEIAEKERKKQQRLAEIKAKNEALALERKREERKRWWDGVDIMVPSVPETAAGAPERTEEELDAETFHQMRYNSNYSRWDQWVPADPATKLEQEELMRVEEQKRNEEFEKNNKDFCEKYLNDMTQREKEKNKKIQGSDSSRLRGNNYFKQKKFDDALKCYMDALKDQPYESKILINIAQVHIKCDATEDALEFLSRVLRVDPKHTKGLSRKAHVLSTLGRTTEALQLARQALSTESDNSDLQRQVLELELAVKTKEDEDAINLLKAKACGKTAEEEKARIEQTLRAEADPAVASRALEEALETTLLATGFELLDKFVSDEGDDPDLHLKCAQLLKADKNMRIYFRTNGAMKKCLSGLRESSAVLAGAEGSAAGAASGVCAQLEMLRAGAADEPANMAAIAVEMPDVVQFLLGMLSTDFSVALQAMQLVNLLYDSSMSTAPAVLFAYKSALGKVSDFLHMVSTANSLIENSNLRSSCLEAGFIFVKTYLFSEHLKSAKIPFPLSKSSSSGLIESLAIAVQVLVGSAAADKATELALEALLGCSQYGTLRGCFGDGIRAINIPSVEIPCPTPLHVIALLSTEKYRRASHLHLCLGILMNICVSDDEQLVNEGVPLKDKVIQSGCLPLVVDIVTATPEKRAKMDPLVLARGAGLLARLAVSPLAADTLKAPSLYRKVVQRFAENINLPDRSEKWVSDECGHLVRIIASLPSLPADCLDVAFSEKLVESILQVFPSPRQEMGEITPSSVVLPPTVPISAILVGNAARCLMPLADDSKNGDILFRKASAKGVEKLICAMANCTDMRVRKNIAILLAKGARIPEVRAKIERFRGMQMLVELQKQL